MVLESGEMSNSKRKSIVATPETGSNNQFRKRNYRPTDSSETQDGWHRYCHGSIVRMKLVNFLTYDDVEFRPGPSLNVIVGPNGTGKSSIVCALCLGLGEKPSTLGRAKEVGEFVKHKKTKATIEIELHNPDGYNYVIKRDIHKGDNRTVWHFNGRQISFNEIKERMKQLNIQMGNLCQFLPQDRVVEFARMSQQQLLEATEKAVGPPGMYEDHQKMIEYRGKEQTVAASLKEKNEHKERLVQRNLLLEREVMRFQERQKHLDQIDILEKKKPWAQYEESRLAFVAMKKEKEKLEKELKEAKKISAPMQKKLDQISEKLAGLKSSRQNLNEDGHSLAAAAKKTSDQLEKQAEKIEEILSDMKSMKEQEKVRQQRMKDLQTHITSLERDFEEAPDPEILQPRLVELNNNMRSVNRNITILAQEVSELKENSDTLRSSIEGVNSQLKEINNINNSKLQKLRQIDQQAYDAVQWLNNNRHKFNGHVYEPIMLQINVKEADSAKYLEATIAHRDLVAFVCESKEDQQLFLHEVREKQKISVNVVYPASTQPLSDYKPNAPIQNIRKYGFSKFVADLFDAPAIVTRYLYESYGLYNIPVADTNSKELIEQAIRESGFNFFFTPTQRYKISKSLYGNRETSTLTSEVWPKNLMTVSVDHEKKKTLETEKQRYEEQHRINHNRQNFLAEKDGIQKKALESLRLEKKELQKQMHRRKALQTQIETKRKTLENIQKEDSNVEKEEMKAKKEITNINKRRVKLATEYKCDVEKYLNLHKQKIRFAFNECEANVEKTRVQHKMKESLTAVQHLEDAYQKVGQECCSKKDVAKRLLGIARKKTNTPDKEELSGEYKKLFEKLPNTVDEIDDKIHEEKAKADCHYQTNPEVLSEYKRNNSEIDKLNREIEFDAQDQENIQHEIQTVKQRWLKPLESLIGKINEQYCDFFKRMGCAGQVTLYKDPDNNYSKYGIEIKVTYRSNEKLKVLTAHHQSGGERSVATMLYLISLQELTKCPFRVVDEINQGMDANNERRVFDLVVETVCRPDTSQYFLITPKLLPDLRYTERMTILSVLNGHWLPNHTKFNIEEFIRKKKLAS